MNRTREFPDEARLADAGLTRDQDDLMVSAHRSLPCGL
jgi:hypothetical protein